MSEALGLQSALAEGYLRKKEYKQAEDAARRALDNAPEDDGLRRFLVLSLIGQARWKAAIVEGKALAGRRPEDAESCRILGECLLRGDKPGAARAVLRRAVRLDPEHRLGMALLARADIAVSSKPDKRSRYDKQEQGLYDEFGWPVEELELSQATMTLDELDLEELAEFPSSLAELPVADADVEAETSVESEAAGAASVDSEPPIEITSSSIQAIDDLDDVPEAQDAPDADHADHADDEDGEFLPDPPRGADGPPPPDDDELPIELTGSAIQAIEDLPMELTGSSIQAIEDLPPEELAAAIPEIEPDLAEEPDELDDDEATREWDISLHPPRPADGGAGPSRQATPVISPQTTPAPIPAAGPLPPRPRPQPAAGPAPPEPFAVDTPREGTPLGTETGATDPGRPMKGPWILALAIVGALVVVGVGAAVVLKSGRASEERLDEVRRALQTGRDADFERATVLLAELQAGGGGAEVAALSALNEAAKSHEMLAPIGPAKAALAAAEIEAPDAAATCAARGYLELRAGQAATARATLVSCAERHPGDPWLRYLLGRALASSGDRAGATTQLDEAIRVSPGLIAARIAKAELFAARRKWDEARGVLSRVPVPDHPQALVARARLALDSGAPPSDVDAALSGLRAGVQSLSAGRKSEADLLRARRHLAAGKLDAAGKSLSAALSIADVDHPRFLLEAAGVALDVWRTREASGLLDRAAQAGAQGLALAVLRARLELLLGRPEEALRTLEAAPVSDPRTHLLRARAHLATGHVPAARRSLLAAADRPDAAVVEALVSYREGRSDEAIGRLRALADGSAEAAAALGRILAEEGRSEEALQTLDAGIRKNPGDPRLLAALGRVHLREGAPAEALEAFGEALRSFPEDSEARVGLAAAKLRSGDGDGARAAIDKLLKAERPPADALLVDAELSVEKGDVKAARKALGRAQASGASGLDANRVAGLVALAEHRPDKAVEVLRSAAQESPRSTTLRLALARALTEAGKAREARTALKDVLRRDPEHPGARLLLGRALLADEYDLEAIRELSRAAKSAKTRGASKKQRGEILSSLALAHYYNGDYGQALVLLDDAATQSPGRAEIHLVRGKTFEKLRRPDRATEEFEAAVQADSGLAEAHFRYGAALLRRGGSKETATAHLRRYLALAPSGRYRTDARKLLGGR